MELNVLQLKYFVAVAEARSQSEAAKALFITTPSLSEQMAKLQTVIGFKLFEREGRTIALTSKGREFLAETKTFLEAHENLTGFIRSLRLYENPSKEGKLLLGFAPGVVGTKTNEVFKQFRDNHPDVELVLTMTKWGEQTDPLLAGKLDAAIVRGPLDPGGARLIPLMHEPRAVVMSESHPLATRSHLQISDLTGVVQVATSSAPKDWISWWAIDPRPDGSRATFGHDVNSVEEMLQVVAATGEICITPLSFKELYPRNDVVFVPLIDAEPTEVSLLIPDAPLDRNVEALLTIARGVLN